MRREIGIAMSGGVDSTATALLLRQQYGAERLQGFFMRLAQPDFAQQLHNVEEIAEKIGIPLHVIDLQQQFEEKILNYFARSYFCGSTPNPCMICNKEIKFGLFIEAMLAAGAEKIATGHYARLSSEKPFRLFMGRDRRKDQSYFLSRLNQEQLEKILFPLGEMEKQGIYHFVEQHGFTDFRGKESQDVCFLEKTTIGNFLSQRQTKAPGSGRIVDTSGRERGRHSGLYAYTIGQRKGLGISNPKPLYVVALNPSANEVVVGEENELFQQSVSLNALHWLQEKAPERREDLLVKIRYTHQGAPARLKLDGTRGELFFTEPQRAVTPGQFAVFYQEEELLGSGVIQ